MAATSSFISATMMNTGSGLTRKITTGGFSLASGDDFDEFDDANDNSPRERRRHQAAGGGGRRGGGGTRLTGTYRRRREDFDGDLEDPPEFSALDEVSETESDPGAAATHTPTTTHFYKKRAPSNTTINPLLAGHAEKVKVRVRIVYADRAIASETRDMTPQDLFGEVNAHEAKTDNGASRNSQSNSARLSLQNPQEPIDRRELVAHTSQRDIRRLTARMSSASSAHSDSSASIQPHLLIRRHVAVVAFGAFTRALIFHNRVFLIVAANEGDRALDAIEKHIVQSLSMGSASPSLSFTPDAMQFEAHVYETLFMYVLTHIKQQYEMSRATTQEIIRSIGDDALLSVSLQEQMRLVKDSVRELNSRVEAFCRLLGDVLQSDQDEFAFLNLSELARDPFIYNLPMHEGSRILFSRNCDVETIIDSLLIDFEDLQQAAHSLARKISATETSVALRLEASRNELLVATTIISVISSTIGFAGFVTGAFGMNLDNAIKLGNIDGLFAAVVVLCIVFIIASSTAVIVYFERSGWLPKKDYWTSFKQFQQKASSSVANVVPLSQLSNFLEEKTSSVMALATNGPPLAKGKANPQSQKKQKKESPP